MWFLRVVPWIVPGFDATRYRTTLRRLHEHIEREGPFETMSCRMLVEAQRVSAGGPPAG